MSSLKNKITKTTALALVLALTHVFVNAELVRAATARLVAKATAAAQGGAQGRLTTRGNNPVTVNGTSAKSGETIFSGQSIQTPEGVGATVNLPGIGRVDIAPNSNVTVTFEAGRVNVALTSGCAILTADRGNAGSVEAGGSTQSTQGTEGGTIDVCTAATPGGAPVVGQGAAAAAGAGAGTIATTGAASTAGGGGGLFGLGTAGTVGLLAAAGAVTAAAIIVPCRRGPNPSPGTPRGRNDECR